MSIEKEYLISIITVCFNSEKTIERTIESLRNQSYQNFEYIIIDGGSTDSTINVIKRATAQGFEDRLCVISEQDDGIYDAMNKGISQASGKFIGLLNSDDWYENHTVEEIENAIAKFPDVDIFYGYIRIIKDEKEYMVRRNNYDFIMEGNGLIQHPTCFISADAYKDVGVYDTSYRVCADQDLMLRMVNSGKKYHGIDAILTNFSHGGISDNYNSVFEGLRFKLNNGIIKKKQFFFMYLTAVFRIILRKALFFRNR